MGAKTAIGVKPKGLPLGGLRASRYARCCAASPKKLGDRGPAASKGRRWPESRHGITNIVAQTKDAKQHPPHCLSEAREPET